MKSATLPANTEAEVWLCILHPDRKLTPKTVRALLRLSIPEGEKSRMRELSERARAGTLTPEEDQEIDDIERAGAILTTLKSRARITLKRQS